jgi:hypothetical protein
MWWTASPWIGHVWPPTCCRSATCRGRIILPGTVAENVLSANGASHRRGTRSAGLPQGIAGQRRPGARYPHGGRGGRTGLSAARRSGSPWRGRFTATRVLILDEATSSLDQANEDSIMECHCRTSPQDLYGHRAHRLSTVERCDHIFWLVGWRMYLQGLGGDTSNLQRIHEKPGLATRLAQPLRRWSSLTGMELEPIRLSGEPG